MPLNKDILLKMKSNKPGAFTGSQLVIAKLHGKEKVIAPVLERGLGVSILVPEYFDTDRFGTFAGEVERRGSALEAARLKCDVAIEQPGC